MADNNDIREEFSPLLDDELPPEAREELERKLAEDSEALRELDALRKVDELYRGLPRASAPNDLAERVRENVHAESKVTALRPRRIPVALYSGLAAAAMFMIVIGGLVVRDEFIVSPSPSERADLAAQKAESTEESAVEMDAFQAEAEPQADAEQAGAVGDVPSPGDEELVPLRQRMQDERETNLAVARPLEALRAQEEAVPELRVAEPEAPMAGERASAAEAKDQAVALGETESPAPPPPAAAAPMPSEAAADDRAEAAVLGLAETQDADAPSVEGEPRGRTSVAQKRSSDMKELAGRLFMKREDGWYERGYDGEATQVVRRGSTALAEIAPRIAELEALLKLEGDIVFRLDERWYRIPAEDAGN